MNAWDRPSSFGKRAAKYTLLSLFFFFWMAHSSWARELVLDRVVAQVNNRPVLISEVNKYLSRMLSKLSPLEMRADTYLSREKIIRQLIDEELFLQEAERKNIRVTPEEINRALEELKKHNHMNTGQFILELAKEGIPFQQFCNELKRELRKSLIIRYEVINRIVISDAMIQEAFEKRKNKHLSSQKIRLRQIFQPFKPDIPDEEKKTLRLQMDGVHTQIQKEGDFDLAANKYSKGSNLPPDGDMGWIQLKDIAKPLADAIRKLKKGKISGLVESPLGLHIFKVEDIQEDASTLAEVKDSLRKELFQKEFQKRYKAWIKELREAAHIEIRR